MEVSPYKIRSVTGYRKKKNLCIQCGRFDKGTPHECIENYIKADMRDVDLPEEVIDCHSNGESLRDNIDVDKVKEEASKKTIQSYRDRKNLCLVCGKDKHDSDCNPNYERADMRPTNEIESDPRTVITPKKKEISILEEMTNDVINRAFLERSSDEFMKLRPSVEIAAPRPFIVIDINLSDTGQKFDISFLEYMNHKHNYIIFLLGDPSTVYSFIELEKIKKLIGMCPIRNLLDQNIINHLHGCKRFFGFPSRFSTYCIIHNIPMTVFFKNEEKFVLPCNIVEIDNNVNVDIEIVKRNVLSWRV